jgi:UTP--glucose-1-phosphate uridylyltransferase
MNHLEAVGNLPAFIDKMQNKGLQQLVIDTFSYYYHKIGAGESGLVHNRDIRSVEPHEIEDFSNLTQYAEAGERALGQSVRIVLNGGLGTTMGLVGPKSLIEAKNGKSFLEIILKQAEKGEILLALMNSFNTHEDTLNALSTLRPFQNPLIFLQHKFPKILKHDLTPANWPHNRELEWNPPGHGDVFTALKTSGMLQILLDRQIRYAFIHNLDNLGARMETSLLGLFAEHQFPFMMEVAEKTPADIKGGHLAKHKNGCFILREAAQCPHDELEAFQDIRRYRYFNTNNIWINLASLKSLFEEEHTIHLPMILNPKTLDPRDAGSPPVFQVETAMGAAISLFEDATAVRVPRSRFFPVKSCNDLLALRSDCFVMGEDGNLRVNPERKAKNRSDTIKIKLDSQFYGKIDLLEDRFKNEIPSLVDCESLTIQGDIVFEGNITIKGRVIIKNSRKSQAVIKEGTMIDKDITF